MPQIDLPALAAHRSGSFHLAQALTAPEQALRWVNERGFVYFWPIKGVLLPSLWAAVAGERPVAAAHDDAGHITWGWKDDALARRQWYYAKILRKKATLLSLEVAPYFYALSENYGAPEEDYLLQYRAGRMTLAAKQVYEALLDGPRHSLDLRQAARLSGAQGETEFNRALESLQADFKILPVGVAQAGAWKYAFIYTLTARHFPDLPAAARGISEAQAREKLLELYFLSLGAAQFNEARRLFGWSPELTRRAVNRLVERGALTGGLSWPGQPGEWLALPALVDKSGG